MQITAIKKIKNRKYGFDIDGKYDFFLTSDELKQLGLFDTVSMLGDDEELDVPIKDSEYEIIIKENVVPRGKRYALGLLSEREYSEKKLTEKLSQTGYCERDIEKIIRYLKDNNFLSDSRFAESYIRLRIESKSRRYIEQKLFQKGISPECVRESFDNIEAEMADSGIDSSELKLQAIKKVLRSKLSTEDEGNKEKITSVIQKLLRQGFNYSDINEAISDYFSS